jgi:hypothetical protein
MTCRKIAGLWAVAALLLGAGVALGQPDALPPMPVPVSAGPTPVLPPPTPSGPPGVIPPPVIYSATDPPPPTGPFGSGFVPPPPHAPVGPPPGSWLFDPPPCELYAALDVDVVQPRVHVVGSSGGNPDLNWTAAARVDLGYTFDYGGAVQGSYRYLHGGEDSGDPNQGFADHFTLDEHWIDLAYLTRPIPLTHDLRVRLEGGLRTAFFRAHDRALFTGQEQDDVAATYWGLGPEVAVHAAWQVGPSGAVAIFSHTSVAGLFGQTHETASVTTWDDLGNPTTASAARTRGQAVFDLRGELGLSWTLSPSPWARFDLGVRGEFFRWDGLLISEVGPFFRIAF